MPPRAVFFDFDGVIADTENIHVAAWQRTLAALGWEAPDELCARAAEIDDREFLSEVFANRKIDDGDVEGWIRRKQTLTIALLTDSPRIYPGIADLIERLRGRVRLAVVSTTWRENIEAVLDSSGLRNAFEVIVGKEDVGRTKPDPECYMSALDQLAVTAAEAVALEDSATGVAAARAAGIRTLAVGHRHPRGDWAGSSDFIEHTARVSKVLELLGLSGERDE